MGLDAVEIVLRAEELYCIHITDEEAGSVRTVGDFYKLICAKLNVEPLSAPVAAEELPIITQKEKSFWILSTQTPLPAPPDVLPWSPQSVWNCLVVLFVDQTGLKPEEIRENTTINKDLGID